jgi:hypothetical protein
VYNYARYPDWLPNQILASDSRLESSDHPSLLCSMATAGYSGTPLFKKLGIKPEMKVLLLNEPANYPDLLKANISAQLCKKNEAPDLVHLFVINNKVFEAAMRKLQPVYQKNPAISIWVSWYKKSANIPTDITEDTIRNYALKNGLVDVKVCAVSDIWSGLKLVVPLLKRPKI